MNMINSKICVVIPFYQIDPAPLVRAIHSILAQTNVERPFVLVVDDGSPIKATRILEENFPDYRQFVKVVDQKNGGAAKARNTGLDHIPESVTYVAFLDSDDEWVPEHLSNALKVLDWGCDFYFTDHKRTDWPVGRFIQMGLQFDEHNRIDKDAGLFEYLGDGAQDILGKQMVKTSTVVYRKDAMADIRFPEDLVLGEDEVFWVRAMNRSRKLGFCRNVEVLMGEGVNISQGGDWGDERTMELMVLNMRKWKIITHLLPGNKGIEVLRQQRMDELRREFSATVLHRLRRGQRLSIGNLSSFTMQDPGWIFSLLRVGFGRIMNANK